MCSVFVRTDSTSTCGMLASTIAKSVTGDAPPLLIMYCPRRRGRRQWLLSLLPQRLPPQALQPRAARTPMEQAPCLSFRQNIQLACPTCRKLTRPSMVDMEHRQLGCRIGLSLPENLTAGSQISGCQMISHMVSVNMGMTREFSQPGLLTSLQS